MKKIAIYIASILLLGQVPGVMIISTKRSIYHCQMSRYSAVMKIHVDFWRMFILICRMLLPDILMASFWQHHVIV